MSWWQNKLLRYALRYGLSRTGFLNDEILDLENLNITIGSKNVIELKDVGLNIENISKQLKLPPCLRLETARVILLRLTIPADVYKASIVAEVDGVDLVVRFEDQDAASQSSRKARPQSPTSSRTPQHRKTNRRLHSTPPREHEQLTGLEESVHFPSTQEVAKSFLKDESLSERKELEASVATYPQPDNLEESLLSDGSESDDIGTGIAVGLPGFLAKFLQGIVDRFVVDIKNVEVRVETDIGGDAQPNVPVTLRLRLGSARLDELSAHHSGNEAERRPRRTVRANDISLDLLTDAPLSEGVPPAPDILFTAEEVMQGDEISNLGPFRPPSKTSSVGDENHSLEDNTAESTASLLRPTSEIPPLSPMASYMFKSDITRQPEEFDNHSHDENDIPRTHPEAAAGGSELDIQLGDDNISWGSRRSQSSAPAEDLWSSMASEDDLPDSLLIEPERASTPRASSSRETSPSALRARRPVSPYDRAFRGPGSWPTLEDNPVHPRSRSPQSWPRLDQSQHSAYEPLAHVLERARRQQTDNKKVALEHSAPASQYLPPPAESEVIDNGQDMSQSRFFSHEEAQSMYMSAMTSGSGVGLPGQWTTETDSNASLPKSGELAAESPDPDPVPKLDDRAHEEDHDRGIDNPCSGNVTPRPQTPIQDPVSPAVPIFPPQMIRQLVSVDTLAVILPPLGTASSEEESPAPSTHARASKSSHHSHNMPGTFLAYSDMSSSRRGIGGLTLESQSNDVPSRQISNNSGKSSPIDLEIGTVRVLLDEGIVRSLLRVSRKAVSSIERMDGQAKPVKPTDATGKTTQMPISVSMKQLSLSICDHIEARSGSDTRPMHGKDEIIGLHCERLCYTSSDKIDLKMRAFGIAVCGVELLSFSPDEESALASRMLSKDETSIAVQVSSYQANATGRSVEEVSIETSPLKLRLDTAVIEEAIMRFGGVDNIIDLGTSFASDTAGSTTSRSTKASKGVRFAGESSDSPPGTEYKINARVGGLIVTLCGSRCAILLRTTTLKAVHRELGSVATVEHISLTGPYDEQDGYHAPVSIDLISLRLDYLVTPHDKDLERLLSLLTPSKDKYENDDDILVDILLRQRQKGGLLRLSIGVLKFKLDDWACTSSLSALSDELTKLSAVAEYLPEDERPGLLTLCRVKEFECQLPVNEDFGDVRVTVQDFHLAHVGLPALLAFSIGTIGARRMDKTELLCDLLPLSEAENLPMIMARMLGDEADPIVKIKLYNICVEYNPSLIIDLTNAEKRADVEEVAASLIQTVANLAVADVKPTVEADSTTKKRVTIDLLIHESAIGLSPHELTSKALFVLTDAHFTTRAPPDDVLIVRSDFRQASILLTDNVMDQNEFDDLTPIGRGQVRYASGRNRLLDSLSKRGFVTVVSIMSAFVTVRVREDEADGSRSTEVDIKNELLLLETCADSTQTLIATLGALAPPAPPSSVPKYLTEPMSIEDMMASFTGDAVEERASSPETLFDADADVGSTEDLDLPLEYSGFIEDADGLLAESEMTSSLYGPISGVLGMEDPDLAGSVTDQEDFPETAESLLEEDPFEMTISPEDMPLGDAALIRSLDKQYTLGFSSQPADMDLHEADDLGFDTLPNSQAIEGDQHRLNTPLAGQHRGKSTVDDVVLPFRLRLRDLHVIWNLYDGYDWQWTQDGIAEAVEKVEQKAEARRVRHQQSLNDREDEESVIGDFLFNSIYIGVPAGTDAQDLRRQINRNIDDQMSDTESVPASAMTRHTNRSASTPQRPRQRRRLRLGRSRNHKIAFELKGVSADVLSFPPGKGDMVSSVDLRLRDFEIFDNIPSSTWRKFLTHLNNDPATREKSKPMFHIAINTVKTIESHSASELTIRVSVLPLRLHVDQDALDFITRFFEFKDQRTVTSNSGGEQPFLQRIEVDTVDLCLDYKPKYVDYVGLRSGRTKEFINFVTLDGANIRLKHAIVYGLRGFDTLHDTLNNVWMPDVTRNQLPTVLAGLAPVRSLVNIGSGVRDVVAIPIREYQKDGRIVRSIQKGAYHFGKTTASELARLGAKVALGTQNVLTTAEEYLSPTMAFSKRPGSARGSSSDQAWNDIASDDEEPHRRAVSAYANQPLGVLSGLRSARRQLEHDLLTAKDALIAVQGEVLESRGPGAAAAAVARHAPTVILRPVIGATRAVGTTLLGVGNQIDRSNVRKAEDKYKRR